MTENNYHADLERVEIDSAFAEAEEASRAAEPSRMASAVPSSLTQRMQAEANDNIVSSVPTVARSVRDVAFGDYPALANFLGHVLLAEVGSFWSETLRSSSLVASIPVAAIVADLDEIIANEHITDAALRSWLGVHAAWPAGLLSSGKPAIESFSELRAALASRSE